MLRPLEPNEERWLDCLAEMAAAGRRAAAPLHGTAAGRTSLGRGAGGDRTLEIDRACEDSVLEVLGRCAPVTHTLVSEETGIREAADSAWRVVLDPLDGSLNAKRGLQPFCISVAVAEGAAIKDVCIAHVEDYLRPDSFTAVRGAGLVRSAPGVPVEAYPLDRSRLENDSVEVVLLEAGRPDRHSFCYRDLSVMAGSGATQDMRVRQIGSLALSLCLVAVGVADVLVAAVRSRAVDIAAGLLVLAEAGGGAATFFGDDLMEQPLDLEKRCAFVAWRAGLDGAQMAQRAKELGTALMPSAGD